MITYSLLCSKLHQLITVSVLIYFLSCTEKTKVKMTVDSSVFPLFSLP